MSQDFTVPDWTKPVPYACFSCGDGNTALYCLNCARKGEEASYALEVKTSTSWQEICRRDSIDELRAIQQTRWNTEQTVGEVSRIVEVTRRVVE